MKRLIPFFLILASQLAFAVPAEINYQGRLTDGDGNPAAGTKTFSLKVFDAATGGNELYSETIGSVIVDDNGIYNFQFGAGGSSTVAASELIATTDGSTQVFNATLSELPIDGSVSISDGSYTWSQSGGSSNPSEFTGSVTVATGAISAIYLTGAPASGSDITANYNYNDSSIIGALTSAGSHWLELTVDGQVQTPRERILSAPFAHLSAYSTASLANSRTISYSDQWNVINNGYAATGNYFDPVYTYTLPRRLNSTGNDTRDDSLGFKQHISETWASKITGMRAIMAENAGNGNPSVSVTINRYSVGGGHEVLLELNTNVDDSLVEKTYSSGSGTEVALDFENYSYYLTVSFQTGGQNKKGGGILKSLKITYGE